MASTPLAELKPDSNSLSKLCFYASGRPRSSPRSPTSSASGRRRRPRLGRAKASASLAVTVDVMKGLVTECRTELQCFAEKALRVAEAALTYKAEGGGNRRSRRGELVCTGSFLTLDEGVSKEYISCLEILSGMSRLSSESSVSVAFLFESLSGQKLNVKVVDHSSQKIALDAIDGTSPQSSSTSRRRTTRSWCIASCPLSSSNCSKRAPSELAHASVASLKLNIVVSADEETTARTCRIKTPASRHQDRSPLASRHQSPPPPTTRSPRRPNLAQQAAHTLHALFRSSHSVQLSCNLDAAKRWFDSFEKGALWEDYEFIEWFRNEHDGR
ncbi:plasma membrane localization protein [Sarracenia purpurea var. burkii]